MAVTKKDKLAVEIELIEWLVERLQGRESMAYSFMQGVLVEKKAKHKGYTARKVIRASWRNKQN